MSLDRDEYFDELYDESDGENEDKNEHRLVIFHLVSQLTRNTEISRLSLPASLCERRSILETYSDYFSRAHLWLNISLHDSANQRMVACLKWYLSAFNASRKSKLARKPYNPILGEIFKCKFVVIVDGEEKHVSYIAEQVSHHPPILAFHVEDNSHQIILDCQIYLKSKFLGLSVSVDMIGEARLKLAHRNNEEYIITFPTAYCNSIYTKPWLELGGKARIICPTTGYEAKINFKRYSYFFGQKDNIEASIFQSNKRDLFLSIKGDWNGVLLSRSKLECEDNIFMDVTQIPLIKAIVVPRSKQAPMESRKVWENVTYFLKNKDLSSAMDAKVKIELEQRNKIAARLESGEEWIPRHFKKIGEVYTFIGM